MDVRGGGRPCRACAIAGILGLVAAVGIAAAARGDALPEDTRRIQSLSPEKARTLAAEFPGVDVVVTWHGNEQPLHHALPLDGLQTLDDETAQALAGYTKGPILLGGLTALDAPTARALAKCGAGLDLVGRARLDADAARALAGAESEALCLDGLTTLDATAASHLAAFGGSLSLRGLAALNAGAAAALAANDRWDGHLPDLHTLDSVAVAAALAAREGPLTLPYLQKSSLQALAALARKEDVEIPPLDSLELIPAPDGSPHDDVVIPDAFRERQRQRRGLWLGPGARPAEDDPVPETL